MNEGWAAKELSHEYGAEDHLTRANFEAGVHRFGYDKTVYQTLQLNQLVKDAKDFNAFKTEAGKLLTNLNVRQLQTQFDTAKATANATANVLRAVASGAKFMRHKATQDTKTRPVHAALHNKVWRIDNPRDTEWRRFVVPLGFGCRCNDIFEDDYDGEVITNEDAERLIGPDEVVRLTRDGFLQDRVEKKALFTSTQSYLDGLNNPEQVKFKLGQLKYTDQGQQRWKDIDQSKLPAYQLPDKTKQDVLDDFAATAVKKVKRYTDFRGAPIFQGEKDVLKHLRPQYLTTELNRQKHYFTIEDTLSDPDEVYFFDKSVDGDQGKPAGPNARLTYTYLKFYQDDTVLAALVEFDKDLPQSLRTWYQLRADDIDRARAGLLIHKK